MHYLSQNDVASGIHYPIALSKLKAYKYLGQYKDDFQAHTLDQLIVSIPIGDHLSVNDASHVSEVIKRYS